MKVLVQLVGGQPLPNVLVPLDIRPDKTLLVYTSQTDQVRERLEAVIGDCQSLRCDAYDIQATANKLQSELAKFAGDELIFNLTGGTKAMVLAANQVAMTKQATVVYLESERRQNVLYEYCYGQDNALKLTQKKYLPSLITIDQFLDVHIGKGQWQEAGPSKDVGGPFEQAVANAITDHLPHQAEVRQGIRFLGNPDGKRPQIDLDIVVRCGNQFARIECKNKDKLDLGAVKQLNLVTELLGTYTRKFIALTGEQTPEHQMVCNATHTEVIDNLNFDSNTLKKADAERLACKIGEAIGC